MSRIILRGKLFEVTLPSSGCSFEKQAELDKHFSSIVMTIEECCKRYFSSPVKKEFDTIIYSFYSDDAVALALSHVMCCIQYCDNQQQWL